MATIFTKISSGSKSLATEGSMHAHPGFTEYVSNGVSERGVEECEPAGAGETVEHPGCLNEGILRPLWSSMH